MRMSTDTLPKKLPVRPDTRRKFNAIVKATRMTLTESVDAAADHFLAARGIAVEPQKPRVARVRKPSLAGSQ